MSLVTLGNYEGPNMGYEHLSYVYDPQLSSLALLSVCCFIISETCKALLICIPSLAGRANYHNRLCWLLVTWLSAHAASSLCKYLYILTIDSILIWVQGPPGGHDAVGYFNSWALYNWSFPSSGIIYLSLHMWWCPFCIAQLFKRHLMSKSLFLFLL